MSDDHLPTEAEPDRPTTGWRTIGTPTEPTCDQGAGGGLVELLARHRVNYHQRNIGGQTSSTLRYTSCDGCDWLGGWHDEAGWEAHLAEALTPTVEAYAQQKADAAVARALAGVEAVLKRWGNGSPAYGTMRELAEGIHAALRPGSASQEGLGGAVAGERAESGELDDQGATGLSGAEKEIL